MASRDIKFLVKDLKKATVEGARTACVQIMNDLVEAGPAYSGDFSASWYAVAPGKTAGGPRSSTGLYNYTFRNVPKTKFKRTGLYKIVNTSSYAKEALDLIPYSRPTEELEERKNLGKDIDVGGRSPGDTRGQITGDGGATSSAPADWWSTFGVGGGLDKSLQRGFVKGFRILTFGKAPKKGSG